MLPGCLLAGIGLGFTNTPVTNTTTGSVSHERAGIASGIDMSARMISLAINVTLMGFILVEGVKYSLKMALPGTAKTAYLQSWAERIAAGATVLPGEGFPRPSSIKRSSRDSAGSRFMAASAFGCLRGSASSSSAARMRPLLAQEAEQPPDRSCRSACLSHEPATTRRTLSLRRCGR